MESFGRRGNQMSNRPTEIGLVPPLGHIIISVLHICLLKEIF